MSVGSVVTYGLHRLSSWLLLAQIYDMTSDIRAAHCTAQAEPGNLQVES